MSAQCLRQLCDCVTDFAFLPVIVTHLSLMLWYADGNTSSASSPGLAQPPPSSQPTTDDRFQVPRKPAATVLQQSRFDETFLYEVTWEFL